MSGSLDHEALVAQIEKQRSVPRSLRRTLIWRLSQPVTRQPAVAVALQPAEAEGPQTEVSAAPQLAIAAAPKPAVAAPAVTTGFQAPVSILVRHQAVMPAAGWRWYQEAARRKKPHPFGGGQRTLAAVHLHLSDGAPLCHAPNHLSGPCALGCSGDVYVQSGNGRLSCSICSCLQMPCFLAP